MLTVWPTFPRAPSAETSKLYLLLTVKVKMKARAEHAEVYI